MKKLRLKLTGEAEKVFNAFKQKGLSDATIVCKSLKCLEMVDRVVDRGSG